MASVLNEPSITITAATDACDTGGGFTIGSHYCLYDFSAEPNDDGIVHRNMSINYQEAHAVIMLLYNFRRELTGQKVLLYIDNQSVLYSIFKCWSGSLNLMEYIQEVAMLMCEYCIELRVEFTPSLINGLADSLSRRDLDKFNEIARMYFLEFDDKPTPVEYYSDLVLTKTLCM